LFNSSYDNISRIQKSRKTENRLMFRTTWGRREEKEEPKVIAKPDVEVQAYDPNYTGCGDRRIKTSRPVLTKKY
jgi:hypothetical protein